MGQEIADSHFEPGDFEAFDRRLQRETDLLASWFKEGRFEETKNRGGFEMEAWLVDKDAEPAPVNEHFLEKLQSPLVVHELARFNVELNSTPRTLEGAALSEMAEELTATWRRCNAVAGDLGARMTLIGILPTVRKEHLTRSNMSSLQRYRALNEQIFALRQGRPLELKIKGKDNLWLRHGTVMLESAATSFQLHLKVNPIEATRVYNASKILSAPMVAVSANSPFLFGKDLWDETRIPLFEQAVAVGESDLTKRVSFGIRYVHDSIMECFQANAARYPVILPRIQEEPEERLPHLRLHNGTIWRWNRPLIGFDASGAPHIRIEHRVVPAGPSVPDAIANAALYFGAVRALVDEEIPPEKQLVFERARSNFYTAAHHGLDAEVQWLDRRRTKLSDLLLHVIIPRARVGLRMLDIDRNEIDTWLGIIEDRVRTGQTGAAWQRAYAERRGADMQALAQAYIERQSTGRPVHEWAL